MNKNAIARVCSGVEKGYCSTIKYYTDMNRNAIASLHSGEETGFCVHY